MRKEEYADSDLDALDEFEDKELLNLGPWDMLGDDMGLLSSSYLLGKQCRTRYIQAHFWFGCTPAPKSNMSFPLFGGPE